LGLFGNPLGRKFNEGDLEKSNKFPPPPHPPPDLGKKILIA